MSVLTQVRRCWQALLLLLLVPGGAAAQQCTQVDPGVLSFQFTNAAGSSLAQGVVSADGIVALMAKPDDAPATAAQEVATFDPRSGTLRYLTTGSQQQVFYPFQQPAEPRQIAGYSRDGRWILTAPSFGGLSFDFLPGTTGQTPVVRGASGHVLLIDTQNGGQTPIGTLFNHPLDPDQVYSVQAQGMTSDARKVLLSEGIYTVQPTVIGGRTYPVVPSGSADLAASGLFDRDTGTYIDVVARIQAAAGTTDLAMSTDIQMSGDGNVFSFSSERDLHDPTYPFWFNLSINGARIGSMPYLYVLDQDLLVRAVDVDLTRPRVPGSSSQVFLRNIGQTGSVFGIERGVSYIGAPPNPSGANAPAFFRFGQTPEYVVPPPATLPARGFFANSFALVAPEEDRVYFQHTDDLVPGANPGRSQELFSIDVETRQIRQISRINDDFTRRFADSPELLQTFGGERQIGYAGSSANHDVVAYTDFGFTQRTVRVVDAQGRVTIRFARFGTAEYPSSEGQHIMVCDAGDAP